MQYNRFQGRILPFILALILILASLTAILPDTHNLNNTMSKSTSTVAAASFSTELYAILSNDYEDNILGRIDSFHKYQVALKSSTSNMGFDAVLTKQKQLFTVHVFFIAVASHILSYILEVFIRYMHNQDGMKYKALTI